tara:strand:- start:158 stop:1132 length:975 start_codon:yes stop_codon:yes gene_type:complete
MSKPRIFVDGHAGTTGLRVRDWLAERKDIEVQVLEHNSRKSEAARHESIRAADVAILCLPDEAAKSAANWAVKSGTRVLDASSCHRISEDWIYGLPEMHDQQRAMIRDANLVTVPGCYPSSFILLVRPLLAEGLLSSDIPLSIHALSGYSGGGRALIERWESPDTDLQKITFEAPYALGRLHKHVAEMQHYTGLVSAPQFIPAVGPFFCGMRVQVPIHRSLLRSDISGIDIWNVLSEQYRDEPFVKVSPFVDGESLDEWSLDPSIFNGTNTLRLSIIANQQGHLLLVGLLDNLGKGASGAAIQSLNLMLGLEETTGLTRYEQSI